MKKANGNGNEPKAQTLLIELAGQEPGSHSAELKVDWDPDKGLGCTCEQGWAAARGLLNLADKYVHDGKLGVRDTRGLTVHCPDGLAVAIGLVEMAQNFYEVAFKSMVGASLMEQRQSPLTVPGRRWA